MNPAFQPEAWHDFYVMVGGAAAALTGLIFVAVSLHLRPVLRDPWHRGRAGSSLLALMCALMISGAVLIPGQTLLALGAEVVVIALVSPAYSARGILHLPRAHRLRRSGELLAGLIGASLAIAAGGSLIAGTGPGLWLLLPGGVIALATSVWNAWRLMVDLAAEERS